MSQKLQPLYDNGERVRDLFFDEASRVIYYLKSIENKKIKFSTGVKLPNILTAKREAGRILKHRMSAKKLADVRLIKDELANWLVVKENEELAYDTLNNIRRAKDQIEAFWGLKFPHEITSDNVTKWCQWWRENNPDIEMENAVKYMRTFAKYLATKIVNDKPLLAAVPKIQDPNYRKIRRARKKKKEHTFTDSEFHRVISTAPSFDAQVAVRIMNAMATRITETLTMEFDSEVFKKDGKWAYRWSDGQNKADLDGWHFFPSWLNDDLDILKETSQRLRTKRLFPQKWNTRAALKEQQIDWAAWRKRADIGWHWTPHTFRHTCLTRLFNDAKNPQGMICKLYRVSLAVAMDTYIHPTDDARLEMRDALTRIA